MRKLIITGMAVAMLAVPSAAMADKPTSEGGGSAIGVHNSNANENAVWGQDRSFYTSGDGEFFTGNKDLKQSFIPGNVVNGVDLGGVGEQRAAWVAAVRPRRQVATP